MNTITLRRTARVLAGHNWIFSNELSANLKDYTAGSLVEVRGLKKEFIGIGYINPNSLITVRLLTRKEELVDEAFFRQRIEAAIKYRTELGINGDSYRVIFSEGDYLPGLIVDKYADCISVQFLTLGMDMMSDMIIRLLDEILNPAEIVLRNDSQSRLLEGLTQYKKVIKGTLETLPVMHEGSLKLEADPIGGQKTGFFLDQRENRLFMAELATKGNALDLFCYSGAWGLQLAKKGLNVTFVDDSGPALTQVQNNAHRNKLEKRCITIKADVFDFLEEQKAAGNKYEFIVLDPPAFVKSRQKIKEAVRGYRKINALAMSLLAEGGVLATSSCSYHMEKGMFLDMLRDAAYDAGRQFRLLALRSQGSDHPVLLSMPETEYLKCAFLIL